jgi:nitrile hydratase beta subunit
MNGIHDMGGMHGMGPIRAEKNEPVFHAPWEGRAFALRRAMAAWGKWNLDMSRHEIELVAPADYLRLGYYERQFVAFLELLVKKAFVTREELQSGKRTRGSVKSSPALTPVAARALIQNGVPASRDVLVSARFRPGDRVRTRNIQPTTHTRLPRYTRGRVGTVERDHGVFVFPDTNAHALGEKPQHVYAVRFAARELWGDGAVAHDAVHVDVWDDYLEPA